MIRLNFHRYNRMNHRMDGRRIVINNKSVTMLDSNNKFIPLRMNLEDLNKKELLTRATEQGKELINEALKLDTEDKIAEDIIIDFGLTGWKLTNRVEHKQVNHV